MELVPTICEIIDPDIIDMAADGLGTNTLGLSGADSSAFEIDGTELYLKAGTSLDFETKTQLDVTVEVDDTTVGQRHVPERAGPPA